MKKKINNFLKPFGISVHGNGYIKKLQRTTQTKNAFEIQKGKIKKINPVIFDVGANTGMVTTQYLEIFAGATIHAFEPGKAFIEIYKKNFAGNSNVYLNSIALSDKKGNANYYINKSQDTNSLLSPSNIGASSDKLCTNVSVEDVSTNTLDNYTKEIGINSIDILKLDTQGSELSILRGAGDLLKSKSIQLIYTECYFKEQYQDQPLFYDIGAFLKSYGYYLEDIYNPYYNENGLLWCDAIFLPSNV